SQFIENLAHRMKIEVLTFAQTPREIADNLPVESGLSWRLNRFVVLDHAPLKARHGPFVFGPAIAGQHDIRQFRRLRKEEIGHHEQVESTQSSLDRMLIGQRDHWIRADQKTG